MKKIRKIKIRKKEIKISVIDKRSKEKIEERKTENNLESGTFSDSKTIARFSPVNNNREVVRTQEHISENLSASNKQAEEVQRAPERIYSSHNIGDEEAKRYVAPRPVSVLTPTRIEERGFFDQRNEKLSVSGVSAPFHRGVDSSYYEIKAEDKGKKRREATDWRE